LSGVERASHSGWRRYAALLRSWARGFAGLHRRGTMPRPAAGRLREGVAAAELVSPTASAVSVTNSGAQPFHDELRVFEPISKRVLVIPSLYVGAGESLWLPIAVSLGPEGLCRECTNFAATEH